VREYSGTSSYALYATTTYAYDPLDQLICVTDAASNVTTISYDSLGRKTQSNDPDLGVWDYSYDANGNLLTQTDSQAPSRQTLWFGYDALDRLTQKRQTNSTGTLLASYGYDAGTNGKGHRTSTSVSGGASESWVYDARGRKTQATHTVPGLTGTRVFSWAYDSADRVTSITYPAVGSSTDRYTGQRLDGTGLLYYHARHYDPLAYAASASPYYRVPCRGKVVIC
jgi:YD repeat-containing protein